MLEIHPHFNWEAPIKTEQIDEFYISLHYECSQNLEMYKCSECEFETPYKVDKKKHYLSHNSNSEKIKEVEEKPYTCINCNFQTYSQLFMFKHFHQPCLLLNLHNRIELSRKGNETNEIDSSCTWFECNYCRFDTKYLRSLKDHILMKHTSHDSIRWFHCEQCSFKAKKRGYLKLHVRRMHTEPEKVMWFRCIQCKFKTKHKSSINRHNTFSHSLSPDIWLKCQLCPFITKWKNTLNSHIYTCHPP